jgi:hypothetical protein
MKDEFMVMSYNPKTNTTSKWYENTLKKAERHYAAEDVSDYPVMLCKLSEYSMPGLRSWVIVKSNKKPWKPVVDKMTGIK